MSQQQGPAAGEMPHGDIAGLANVWAEKEGASVPAASWPYGFVGWPYWGMVDGCCLLNSFNKLGPNNVRFQFLDK